MHACSPIIVLLLPTLILGEVGDPTIRTDHPLYPGEGAFQTIEDCVRFATEGHSSPQDIAIAQFQWFLTHQYHLMSPEIWNVPGWIPDNGKQVDDDLIVFDANRSRFSFGYGLCGTVHAWNEVYWKALSLPARRRAFPGHVNSEIFYDGSWHAFDTDMAGLVFRPDGVVAGYDDLIKNPEYATRNQGTVPCYPFAWPGDFNSMRKGWQEVARKGKWYALYNGSFAAHPGIVRLRSGETFTRYFDRDHFGGPSKRRFWHNLKGGPFRNWTYVNMGTPTHRQEKSNSHGNASYCNGVFAYEPDLASDGWREGTAFVSPNITSGAASPRLRSVDGKQATVIFKHIAPYVICGDPVDDANPMSKRATDGMIMIGDTVGPVGIEASPDGGQTWSSIGTANGSFRKDLTEIFKGRFRWQIKLSWTGDSGLDRLRFETTTQVSQMIYPRLTSNGCDVTYRSSNRGVVAVIPNWSLKDGETHHFEETSLRSSNLRYQGRTKTTRRAYETTNNRPGYVVFKMESTEPLLQINAAIRYQIRVPTPKGQDFQLDVSTDNGTTWTNFAKSQIPTDNEYSSGWLYGNVDVSKAKPSKALVRAKLYADGYRTGLIDARIYGIHETDRPQPTTLTFGWNEKGIDKTFNVQLGRGESIRRFTVPTGSSAADRFIRIAAER